MGSFTLDTQAPSGGSITYTNGYFTSASVPITYSTGTDSGSGLATATGKIQRASATLTNGTCGSFSSFSDLATEFDGSYTDTTVATANCYKYQYLIQDAVANQATYTSANVAKVDTIIPTTTDNFANNNTWQNAHQTITLTPTDSGGSGLASTKHCVDTDNSCIVSSGTVYTVPVEISTEGTSYFRYASTDNAGNVQTTVSRTVKIDTTAPQTPVPSLGGGQFTDARSVSLTSEGASAIYYTLNNTTPTTGSTLYTGAIGVGESKTIKALAVDAVGNESAVMSEEYIIKDAVPEAKKIKRTIDLLGGTTNKSNKQLSILLPRNGVIRFKISDPDQLKQVTLKIGNKIFVLRNSNKKDESIFTTVLNQFKDKVGKYGYTIVADYGTTQVRQRGTINITAPNNNVLLNDVNKNFREAFGRTPTKTEWTKWAKEVQKGITKQELQKKLKAGK
jgi:hypothetical protein